MARPSLKSPVLPDLLPRGLGVVFCGTAPGRVSALAGHYYAHPQNKFWRTLYATRLTARLLAPSEYALLPSFGIGLTDIAKHVSGQDNELPRGSLGAKAIRDLCQRIEKCAPSILAFTSLTGGRSFLGSKVSFGPQKETIGSTRIWILPSPSPKAHWNWDEAIWRELAIKVRAAIKNAA
jgi:TDG/mug DNA glycosylase family protein